MILYYTSSIRKRKCKTFSRVLLTEHRTKVQRAFIIVCLFRQSFFFFRPKRTMLFLRSSWICRSRRLTARICCSTSAPFPTHSPTKCRLSTSAPTLLTGSGQDNIQFLHDKHIFDTTYFNFVWFLCSNIPPTVQTVQQGEDVLLSNIQLSTVVLAGDAGSLQREAVAKELVGIVAQSPGEQQRSLWMVSWTCWPRTTGGYSRCLSNVQYRVLDM